MPQPQRFILALALLATCAGPARADRHGFVQSLTPYLDTAGSLDLETRSIARSGQGDSTATAWENSIAFEYAVADRFTGSVYLNFEQAADPGAGSRFDGPSLQLLDQLAPPGRLPVDPAAYLELRWSGDALELEPQLLLARRHAGLVGVLNVGGDFERHLAGGARGTTEKELRVTAGLSREIGHAVAIGVEGVYDRPGLGTGRDAGAFFVGPTIDLQSPHAEVALGWHPQVSGRPGTGAGLDLADFPRSEVRLIVAVDL